MNPNFVFLRLQTYLHRVIFTKAGQVTKIYKVFKLDLAVDLDNLAIESIRRPYCNDR